MGVTYKRQLVNLHQNQYSSANRDIKTYQKENQENMKSFYAVAALIAAGLSAAQEVGVRAPARLTIEDCLCQCDSQTFVDKFNRLNGNCKS